MNNSIAKDLSKPRVSLKIQSLAALAAIAAAVALPYILHIAGKALGIGTALGETLLPMHFPVILVGLLAGPFAGAAAGIAAPLISFLLTGMPGKAMLIFIMIELCSYGLFAGLLRGVKMPSFAKLLSVQVAGRAVRAVAILLSFYAFSNAAIKPAIILTSIKTGIFGIVIQWALIPLIVYLTDKMQKSEEAD